MDTNTVNKTKEGKSTGGNILSEAFLIAGLTAAGYFAACAYQIAYLSYFKIPLLFLGVNLSLVLMVGLGGIIWIVGNIGLFGLLIGKRDNPNRSARLVYIAFAALLQIALSILIIVADPTHPFKSFGLIMLTIAGFIFLIYQTRKDLKKDAIPESGVDIITDALEERFGTLSVGLVMLGICFVIFGAAVGLITAKMKLNFTIPSTQPDTAIVSTYEDGFLGLIFNTETKELTNQVRVIDKNQLATSTVFLTEKLKPTYMYVR